MASRAAAPPSTKDIAHPPPWWTCIILRSPARRWGSSSTNRIRFTHALLVARRAAKLCPDCPPCRLLPGEHWGSQRAGGKWVAICTSAVQNATDLGGKTGEPPGHRRSGPPGCGLQGLGAEHLDHLP